MAGADATQLKPARAAKTTCRNSPKRKEKGMKKATRGNENGAQAAEQVRGARRAPSRSGLAPQTKLGVSGSRPGGPLKPQSRRSPGGARPDGRAPSARAAKRKRKSAAARLETPAEKPRGSTSPAAGLPASVFPTGTAARAPPWRLRGASQANRGRDLTPGRLRHGPADPIRTGPGPKREQGQRAARHAGHSLNGREPARRPSRAPRSPASRAETQGRAGDGMTIPPSRVGASAGMRCVSTHKPPV